MGVDMPGVVVDGVDSLVFAAEIFLYEAGSSMAVSGVTSFSLKDIIR